MIDINNNDYTNDRIFRPFKRGQLIQSSNIIYLEAESNYTYVFLIDGTKILLSRTLKHLATLLPKSNFIRIHQSYLVNKEYISKIEKKFLKINENKSLPISRRRSQTLNQISF
jgi:two-component system, LytTR family, response regulator